MWCVDVSVLVLVQTHHTPHAQPHARKQHIKHPNPATGSCFSSTGSLHKHSQAQTDSQALHSTHRAADVVVTVLLEVQRDQALWLCLEEVLYILLVLQAVGAAVVNIQHNWVWWVRAWVGRGVWGEDEEGT